MWDLNQYPGINLGAVWKSPNNNRFETPPDILSQLKRAWGTNIIIIFITITEQYPKLRHRKTHNKNCHNHLYINIYIYYIYRLQTHLSKKHLKIDSTTQKSRKTYVYIQTQFHSHVPNFANQVTHANPALTSHRNKRFQICFWANRRGKAHLDVVFYQLMWIRNLRLLEINKKIIPFEIWFAKKRGKGAEWSRMFAISRYLKVELVNYRHMRVPTSNAFSTPRSGLNKKHTLKQLHEIPVCSNFRNSHCMVAFIFST